MHDSILHDPTSLDSTPHDSTVRDSTLRAADLRPGDLLLYHRRGSWLSDLLRKIDDSEFSHVSIWEGTQVVEALPRESKEEGGGVLGRDLRTSILGVEEPREGEASYAVVYRLHSDGVFLGDPGLPYEPVLERVREYLERGHKYAYAQVGILALAKGSRVTAARLGADVDGVRQFVDSQLDQLNDFLAQDREALTCTELPYRCFLEAGPEYRLDILPNLAMPEQQPLTPPGESADLVRKARRYGGKLRRSKRPRDVANPWEAFAEFVTLKDLELCRNLRRLGRLELDVVPVADVPAW